MIFTNPVYATLCTPINMSLYPVGCNFPSSYTYLNQSMQEILGPATTIAYSQGLTIPESLWPLCRPPALVSGCYAMESEQALSYSPVGIGNLCPVFDDGTTPLNETYLWPVCLDFCQHMNKYCLDLYISFGVEWYLPNCTGLTNDPLVINYNGKIYVYPCLNYTTNSNLTVSCDPDRLLISTPDKRGCDFICPSPSLTDPQLNEAYNLQSAVSWISFIFSLIYIITSLFNPKQRRFPHRLSIYVAIATLPISIGFMLPSFVGSLGEVWCGDSVSLSTNVLLSGNLCVFQAVLILYGTLATVIWWCIMGLNTALLVRLDFRINSKNNYYREFIYHFCGWIIPTIFVAVAAGLNKLGYSLYATYCFVDDPFHQIKYPIAFWIAPIAFLLIMGSIAFGFVLYRASSIQFKQLNRKYMFRIVRIIIFMLMFLIFYIIIFADRALTAQQAPQQSNAFLSFIGCLFDTSQTISECRDILNVYAHYSLQMCADFMLCSQGFFVAIIFLTGFNIFKFWWEIILGRRSIMSNSSSTNTSNSTVLTQVPYSTNTIL